MARVVRGTSEKDYNDRYADVKFQFEDNALMNANPVALLEGLLKIYSPSYHEFHAVEYLVNALNEMGLRAFRDDAGNAVGILEPLAREAGSTNLKEIVLLGHIDTAKGFVDVQRDETNLHGRGAVDAKGPLCAFAGAVANLGARVGWRFVVVGAVEEECPTSKGAHFAKTQYQPTFAIVGEPSGWNRVTLGYKGSLWVEYNLTRAMAHTAGQQKSAAEEAVEFWNAVKRYADAFNSAKTRVFDRLDPTLRNLHSGDDGLHESAKLTIGLRLPVGFGVSELEEKILELKGAEGTLAFSTETPAFRAEKNNALVRAFLTSIREQNGAPGFTLKTGTSDMNILGPYWNCPIVTYGPGDSNLDHTPHEHIEIDEYLKAIDVLTRVLDKLTRGE